MTEEIDVLKSIPPKIIETAYSDVVADTLKELSKLGVDAAKTIRLILFPIQFAGAFQDRLATYISRSASRVPERRRIAPTESLALQIADRLRFQEDANILTEMYVSLLARAMDRDRVGEAHPAFVLIINQLAPDEVLLLEQLSKRALSAYMRLPKKSNAFLDKEKRNSLIVAMFPDPYQEAFCNMMVRPEELTNPDLLFTYIEHLVSLGIVVYVNDDNIYSQSKRNITHWDFWFITLNEFGRLFHSACLNNDEQDP